MKRFIWPQTTRSKGSVYHGGSRHGLVNETLAKQFRVFSPSDSKAYREISFAYIIPGQFEQRFFNSQQSLGSIVRKQKEATNLFSLEGSTPSEVTPVESEESDAPSLGFRHLARRFALESGYLVPGGVNSGPKSNSPFSCIVTNASRAGSPDGSGSNSESNDSQSSYTPLKVLLDKRKPTRRKSLLITSVLKNFLNSQKQPENDHETLSVNSTLKSIEDENSSQFLHVPSVVVENDDEEITERQNELEIKMDRTMKWLSRKSRKSLQIPDDIFIREQERAHEKAQEELAKSLQDRDDEIVKVPPSQNSVFVLVDRVGVGGCVVSLN